MKWAAGCLGIAGLIFLSIALSAAFEGRFQEWLDGQYFELVTEHARQLDHSPSLRRVVTWLHDLVVYSAGTAIAAPFARGPLARAVGPAFWAYLASLCLTRPLPHYFAPLVDFAGVLAVAALFPPGRHRSRKQLALAFLVGVLLLARSFGLLDERHQLRGGRFPMPPPSSAVSEAG